MVLSYSDCIKTCGGVYSFRKALASGKLHKIEKGLYSDEAAVPELAVISEKYPNAVLTSYSAYYYLGHTETAPDKYYLATDKDAAKIRDPRVIQVFENSDILMMGAELSEIEGVKVFMYNTDRMLVELFRNKSKIPYAIYKELVFSYRRSLEKIDIRRIDEYLDLMPKKRAIGRAWRAEVL